MVFCTSHGGAVGILSRSEVLLRGVVIAGMGGVLVWLQGYICHLAFLLEINSPLMPLFFGAEIAL
jgi:hypothetical protein